MHFVNAKGILNAHNGMNLYRGCTHGCIYCDSRSDCYQIDHIFEDIEVKQNAPELLEDALRRKRKKCVIGTGSMCDPYMHCEAELKLTRRCLEIIRKYGFGASVLTKSDLVLRDIDILKEINKRAKCVVQMTLTTYDEKLCRIIEPNVCTTRRRYEVLKICKEEGIPTVVWFTPMLPFINDTEENVHGILNYCFDAGVKGIITFGMGGMTLRHGDREYYYAALDRHFPGLKQIYTQKYGYDYHVPSDRSNELINIIKTECESHGVMHSEHDIWKYINDMPENTGQLQIEF